MNYNTINHPNIKSFTFIVILLLSCLGLYAQEEMTLLGRWQDTSLTPTSQYNNPYNEVWGISVNGYEYAIIGTTYGTHFIDVTDPSNPKEQFVVKGGSIGSNIVHRDYHDHKGYLYAVCQEGSNSTLQIIDFSSLPDTVHVVYDAPDLIDRSHNIFIDTTSDRLYVLLALSPVLGYASMRIIDIQNPTEPELLASHSVFDNYAVGHVHDAYVKNDTAYLNCGNDGLVIADFSDPVNVNTIAILPSSDYAQSGYNHSGWLSSDNKYYIMADETHNKDIKIIDVQNLPELEVVATINSGSDINIPHNQIVKNIFLYSSYYYDGLHIWDISDPHHPIHSHYYDTSIVPNAHGYQGAWGVYPNLPSGNILVSDMQEGLFILEGIDQTVGIRNNKKETLDIFVFPNPATDKIFIKSTLDIGKTNLSIYNNIGQLMYETIVDLGIQSYQFSIPEDWISGIYYLSLENNNQKHLESFTIMGK